jgi:inorganic pyrophosphatase
MFMRSKGNEKMETRDRRPRSQPSRLKLSVLRGSLSGRGNRAVIGTGMNFDGHVRQAGQSFKPCLVHSVHQGGGIVHDAATYPGLVLKCKSFNRQRTGTSERSCVRRSRSFPFEGDLQDIRRLPARAIEELEKFFEATNALESKKLKFQGWRGPAKAIETIKKVAV